MKTPLIALLLSLLSTATWALAEGDNTLSGPERAAGWELLFDGHSIAGWRGFKTEKPGDAWKAKQGELATTGGAGDLLTTAQYGDFELTLEWKVPSGSNSGVIYRVGLDEEATYRTGCEYQVLDNKDASDNKDPKHLAGALYDMVAPSHYPARPIGEWNTAKIVVRGWHIQHWLNGEKVVDVDLSTAEGKALVAASKFNQMPKFATKAVGYIALQDHGDAVSFRNIKIHRLQ